MSVTPDFVGQRYKDTNTGNIWIANSTTPGDWTLEVQNCNLKWLPRTSPFEQFIYVDSESNLTTIECASDSIFNGCQIYGSTSLLHLLAPSVVHCAGSSYAPLIIDSCDSLIDIDLSGLVDIQDEVSIAGLTSLQTIDLRSLVTVSGNPFTVDSLPALTSLRLDSLVSTAGPLELSNFSILTSLSMPNLVSVSGDVAVSQCPLLTTLDLSSWLPQNGGVHSFNGDALLAASVNALLARGVANAGFVSGDLDIADGTNAAPTGQGLVDKATLIARGVNVLTN